MKKGRFLEERVREAIVAQYKHDTLYRMLHTLAVEAEELNPMAQHALSGEDLLYLSADVMDSFLEMDDPHNELAIEEASATWLEVKQRLRAESAMLENELNTAATLVVLSARECLRRGDMWRYWDVCDAMACGVADRDQHGWEVLQPLVYGLWQRDEAAQRYGVWWQQYTNSEVWLSDELADLLLDVHRAAPHTSEIAYKAEIVDALRPFFWDDAVRAESFLLAIYHKSDLDVTSEIMRLKRTKSIDLDRKVKQLHSVLHDARFQLYNAKYTNFAEQLRD